MISKGFFKKLSLLLAVIMAVAVLCGAPGVKPAGASGAPINSAVQYLDHEYTTNGLANNDNGVGSYAFYVLRQAGVDVSAWEHGGTSLEEAVKTAIAGDLAKAADPLVVSAKLLARDLAAADALGENDLADQLAQILQARESSAGFDENSYSDIPAYDILGRAGRLNVTNAVYAKECILAAQNTTDGDPDLGSFGGMYEDVFYPDFMTTAQAVRALHYLDPDGNDGVIQEAINAALEWLKDRQQANGGFLGSDWDDPVTDTAEVIITLAALGLDPADWQSGGNTAVDYMMSDALNEDGSFGTSRNAMDATWALCAYNMMGITISPDITLSPADYSVNFLQNEYTTNGLANNDNGVGSYAFYVLRQAGVDVSAWEHGGTSLEEAVKTAIAGDLAKAADPLVVSAKLLARDLAAADALGENDLADQLAQILQARESSAGFDENSYSDIPAYDILGRAGRLNVANAVYAKECILTAQNTTDGDPDFGSFGGAYEDVFYPDFMTTAQAVRALHYLDPGGDDGVIREAIDAALGWLKDKQQADGGFLGSEWDDPVTDTAEVIITLAALGLDPADWQSGGNTAVDYMMSDALNEDGSFGTSKNAMDATWALCAYSLIDTQFYLDPLDKPLNIGNTLQFKAVWQNAEGSFDVTPDAAWTTADGTVASVDSSGLVTALAAGKTRVNAVYNGLTASAQVTVQSSSQSGDGGNEGTDIGVNLAVVGQGNQLIYGPSRVSINKSNSWGLTALGALDASGLDYQTSSWSYGDFVCSIEGQANSGLSGWMYTVNGTAPGVGADKYTISNQDKIIFYYSESMDQQPPKWDELEKQQPVSGGGSSSAGQPEAALDNDLNAAVKNAQAAGQVALAANNDGETLALSKEQMAKVRDTGVPLAVTIQGAQFLLSPDFLKTKEITSEQTATIEFTAQKLSSEDARELMKPFTTGLKLAGEIYELSIQVLDKDGKPRDIAHLTGCTVLLPVPAGMEEAAAAGMLTAYYYNEESGQWEEIGGTYDPENEVVSFDVDHFSKYALMETVAQPVEEVVFIDIVGHWAHAEIEYMAEKGFVSGVGEKQFAPENKITRAEFASILARMAGLEPNAAAAGQFRDVPVDAWYRGTVGAAAGAGLVCGMSENSFAPGEPVTREQMAAMLVRLIAEKGGATDVSDADADGLLTGFSDAAAISAWAGSAVAQAVSDGLMVGRDSGIFVPLGSATRAEATAVLYRALQKLSPANEVVG